MPAHCNTGLPTHECIGHRLPSAAGKIVPAQNTMRMNAFVAARGDKTAMRPFAKLFWTHLLIFGTFNNHASYLSIIKL